MRSLQPFNENSGLEEERKSISSFSYRSRSVLSSCVAFVVLVVIFFVNNNNHSNNVTTSFGYHTKETGISSENIRNIRRISSLDEIPKTRRILNVEPQQQQQPQQRRQVMHTFYAHIESHERGTGMTDNDDRNELQVWQEMWHAAGWDTKILTLADAQKHPDYKEFSDKLEKDIFKVYDQLCFLRWLAMAANGGGWMCDYDVFPMPNFQKDPLFRPDSVWLPFEGKLTVYEYTAAGGVPSIISAKASEWDRVAHLLLERQQKHGLLSDMFALINLHEEDEHAYNLKHKVLKGHFALGE